MAAYGNGNRRWYIALAFWAQNQKAHTRSSSLSAQRKTQPHGVVWSIVAVVVTCCDSPLMAVAIAHQSSAVDCTHICTHVARPRDRSLLAIRARNRNPHFPVPVRCSLLAVTHETPATTHHARLRYREVLRLPGPGALASTQLLLQVRSIYGRMLLTLPP